ncbi:hypothetical protein V6Z11_A02G182300 [Gossypium hirsutum]
MAYSQGTTAWRVRGRVLAYEGCGVAAGGYGGQGCRNAGSCTVLDLGFQLSKLKFGPSGPFQDWTIL